MFLNGTTELRVACYLSLVCKILPGNHRPRERQNPALVLLAYLLRIRSLSMIWQPGFLTCFSLRKSQITYRLRLRLFPSDLTTRFSYLFLPGKPQPTSRLGLSGWPNTTRCDLTQTTIKKNHQTGADLAFQIGFCILKRNSHRKKYTWYMLSRASH